MFHDDMIMYGIINDQQSVIAVITRSSPWSNLWILWTNGNSCTYEWNFQNFVHMHEFSFVHKIHKFDHGDDLVIMAMTGCWSCMKISFMAVFMAPKPKAKFVEIWLNVFDAGVWRLSRRRGVWGVAEAKVSPLKIREWFCTKKSFSKPAKTEVLSLKKHPKNMCNIPFERRKKCFTALNIHVRKNKKNAPLPPCIK